MNHKLEVVRAVRSIENLNVLGTNRLKVTPVKELLFEGTFYCPLKTFIKVENICLRNIAFVMETSSPERFMITPKTGLVEPDCFADIEILMYPNVANEDIANHSFTMFYVVALGEVSLPDINREWMDEQPHHTTEENWTCGFKEGQQQKSSRATQGVDTFYDCEPLPKAPVIRRLEGIRIEKMRQVRKLRKENAKLCEQLHWLKMKILMEANEAHDPRNNYIRLSDILDAKIEDIFMVFGINVYKYKLKFFNIRVVVVLIQIAIFFGGFLFGKYLF